MSEDIATAFSVEVSIGGANLVKEDSISGNTAHANRAYKNSREQPLIGINDRS
jgi:hypothetical protein